MKKVKNLMIVAHPDDELVFGWAELIKYGTLYKVVCISYKNNKIRSKEFENVMTQLNVSSYEMWDFKDSLQDYIHTLDENISYEQKVFKNLLNKKWEKIVTHNPIGEYGHPKHKRLFETIKKLSNKFYVFGKDSDKLPDNILNTKLELLKLYKSQQSSINQLKNKNKDWSKSAGDSNYIEYEKISRYVQGLDKKKYIPCYEKSIDFGN